MYYHPYVPVVPVYYHPAYHGHVKSGAIIPGWVAAGAGKAKAALQGLKETIKQKLATQVSLGAALGGGALAGLGGGVAGFGLGRFTAPTETVAVPYVPGWAGAATGALLGGGLGAGIGALAAGEENRLRGALLGAGLGAGLGGAAGYLGAPYLA